MWRKGRWAEEEENFQGEGGEGKRRNGFRERTDLFLFLDLAFDAQRMTAARVGPHAGEGDLFVGSSLEEQRSVRRPEQEHGERPVEEGLGRVDVGHQMAC